MTWLEDGNGNKCSVEYFGSREAAQKALDSLKDCKGCINCSDCSSCSYCSDCSSCGDCSDCSDCSDCGSCSSCGDCGSCSSCSYCSYCRKKENVRGVVGTSIQIPVIESIHRKVYAAVSAPARLEMSAWHSCETTHCRGGWVVTLAGEAGKALESFHGTLLAAQLIYRESGYQINPARFFDSNADALEDMRRLAELEAAQEAETK
jgi:hypothetical protein